jgi:hypothetical protein
MRHSPKKRIGRTNGLLPFSSIEWLKATITAHNLVACCKRRNQVDEGPFAAASGVQANIVKCQKKTPIRCSDDQVSQVQQFFPCQLTNFPCKWYLGVPLSVHALKKAYFQPLVDCRRTPALLEGRPRVQSGSYFLGESHPLARPYQSISPSR